MPNFPTKDNVLALARRYMPEARAITGVLDSGLRHVAYEIDEQLILKVPRPRTPLDELARESFVLRQSGKMPVPRVLGFDVSGRNLPHLCMSRVDGTALSQHGPTWPGETIEQVGQFLARLHRLDIAPFQEAGSMQTLDVEDFWRMGMTYLAERSLITEAQKRALNERFCRGRAHLSSVSPSLIHSDLWPLNCFFDPTTSQLTGIIDIPEGQVRWVNVQELRGFQDTFCCATYGVSEPKITPTFPKVNIRSVRVRSHRILGSVVRVDWKGEDFGLGLIDRLAEHNWEELMRSAVDIEISAHPKHGC